MLFLIAQTAVSPETVPGTVAVPMWMVMSFIVGILGAIGTLAKLAWDERSKRLEDKIKDLTKMSELMNTNNNTLEKFAITLGGVGDGLKAVEQAIKEQN